jgi:hypothetical protein
VHYELQPPEAAIPPEEDAVSIDVVVALRDSFAKESPAKPRPKAARRKGSENYVTT